MQCRADDALHTIDATTYETITPATSAARGAGGYGSTGT
jgi:dUTPase